MMLMVLAAVAAAAPQAAPAARPNPEQQVRTALAASGMSKAGIDALVAVDRKHSPALRAILVRGRTAEEAARAALTARPVDVERYAAANLARADAGAALQRETATVAIEQLRALSPADRAILATKMSAARPAAAPPRR